MRTLNTKYTTDEALKTFIQTEHISANREILLQIFTGKCDEVFIRNLVKTIVEIVPHIKIIGSTTDGEIYHDSVTVHETILSFSLFEETEVVTYFSAGTGDSYTVAKDLIKQFPNNKNAKVAIAFTEGLQTNGEVFLNAFYQHKPELIIAGGLAGDNANFQKTIIFTEKEVLTEGGVIALFYNDNLQVKTRANFGWTSIGKALKVTKAKDNIVYEIDGMTPVALYNKYLGKEITANLPKTGIEFPLIVRRGELDIARAVIGKHEDGSLLFAGNLKVGDKVKFGYGNVESIIEGGNALYEEFEQLPSEAIFIYSCMARKSLLGSTIASELQLLSKIAPLSGFFTYGEFYTNEQTSKNELLNQTMTILSLSEKEECSYIPDAYDHTRVQNRENLTTRALSHLITQTTLELEQINNTLEEKVQEELERNRAKDQKLLEQSRMAQMGEMISMIAHQWRQPLGAIAATSIDMKMKLLFDSYELSDEKAQEACKEYFSQQLEHIEEYVQNLTQTIDDFRNFYKPNKEKKILCINEPIKKSLSIVEAAAKAHNIMIETHYKSTKELALYDSELMQVFLNIIKNSQDNFSEKKIENATIIIETRDTKEGVIVEICDNGGGIPAAIIEKIFDPYFSTKDEKNGTGLGLYMSKTIVEEHHKGKLWAQNREDGVKFCITLYGE